MDKNTTEIANTLIRNGLSVIPVKEKIPTVPWKEFQKRVPRIGELSFNGSVGLVCGSVSGGVEGLDIDIKNAALLFDKLQRALEDFSVQLPDNFVFQNTPSGGAHFIYRSPIIEGNQILAKSMDGKVLIETRGNGGYICISPTPGYQITQGTLTNIPYITEEQRETLFAACRSLNEFWQEVKTPTKKNLSGLTPWADYDQRGDVPELLQSHDWQFIKSVGDNEHYCRPGKKGTTSATWCEGKRLFYVFTSSTVFEPGRAYTPSAVYCYLECSKDFSEAGRKLSSLGYGEKGKIEPERKKEFTPDEIQTLWKDRLITEQPEDDVPLLHVEDVPVLIQGNHTVIVGKKKSRKTLFLVWLLSQYKGSVLFFDTEQGRKHVWLIRQKVRQLSGRDLPVFFLRGMSPKDRRDFIYQTVKLWHTRPQVVVIDGIRDLMSNINDPDESTELIVWLESLIKDANCGVLNVLHLNKTDNNARGHIGTELGNKSFMLIEIEKDNQTGVSLVKCADSRDEPFESFAFTHGADGLPELVGMPSNGRVLTDGAQRDLLTHAFEGELLSYSDLIDQLKAHFEVGTNKAKTLLAGFSRKGWIVKSGGLRSRGTRYKLML
jgi:hypothetical protein